MLLAPLQAHLETLGISPDRPLEETRSALLKYLDKAADNNQLASTVHSVLIQMAKEHPKNKECVITGEDIDLGNIHTYVFLSTGHVYNKTAFKQYLIDCNNKNTVARDLETQAPLSFFDLTYLKTTLDYHTDDLLKLIKAIDAADLRTIRYLLKNDRSLLNQSFYDRDAEPERGRFGYCYTPLGYAASLLKIDVMEVLLNDFLANPNAQSQGFDGPGLTALHHLVREDNAPLDPNSLAFKAASLLVNKGANPDQEGEGITPRQCAENSAPSLLDQISKSVIQGINRSCTVVDLTGRGANCRAVFSRNDRPLTTLYYQLRRNATIETAAVTLALTTAVLHYGTKNRRRGH